MIRDLHHVALVVESADTVVAFLERAFGIRPESRKLFEEAGVDLAVYRLGSTFLEVSAPTRPGTPLGRFLAEHGPGVHHVAFAVADVSRSLSFLAENGCRLLDASPVTGRSGWTVGSLDTKGDLGVIVQLVQQPASTPDRAP